MHKEAFVASWKDLKNKPILFLPNIIALLVNLILGLLFLKYSGLLKLITDPEMIAKGIEAAAPVIKLFFKENLLRLIITFSIFVITSFIIGSGLTAMKLGMMRDLVKRRKLTLVKMYHNGKHTWEVISMKMIIFAIGIVMFLFILGTGIILAALLGKVIAILIMSLFLPVLIIALQLMLFFRYQTMFLKNENPVAAIKDSFNFFLRNKKYVLIVWLIIIAIYLIAMPASTLLSLTERKLAILSITAIIGSLIRNLINLVINVWTEMFKFRSYKSKL